MKPLTFEYQIGMKEIHTAVFFGQVTRYRNAIRIFVVVAAVALICWLGAVMGLIPYIAFPSYIFLGYLIWLLFLMARTEHDILKMTKQPNGTLQHPLRLTFERNTLKVETPHNREKAVHQLDALFLAFELSNLFILYISPANAILLPLRVLDAEQRVAVREKLQESLHDRFQTRFGIYKTPKMQSLSGRRGMFR